MIFPRIFLSLLLLATPVAAQNIQNGFPIGENDSVNAYLADVLSKIRARTGVPALSAALVKDGRLAAQAVVGTRVAGEDNPAQIDDGFALGSVTKPLTGFLVARMVDQGIIRWDTTLEEIFPELWSEPGNQAQTVYKTVTVAQLMAHQSGLSYVPKTEPGDMWAQPDPTNLKRRRLEYVRCAIKDIPENPSPYSGGSIVVAAMLERLTGKTWETLVQQNIYTPLGMTHSGFLDIRPEEGGIFCIPGHDQAGFPARKFPWSPRGEVHGPAGTGVMSIGDLARFCAANLPDNPQGAPLVSREVLLEMQTRYATSNLSNGGWWLADGPVRGTQFPTLSHSGYNGHYTAACTVAPQLGAAFVSMTNTGHKTNGSAALSQSQDELQFLFHHYEAMKFYANRLSIAGLKAEVSDAIEKNDACGPTGKCTGENLVDGELRTRWATSNNVTSAIIQISWPSLETINGLTFCESTYYGGERVRKYRVAVATPNGWKQVGGGEKMGANGHFMFDAITTNKIAIEISDSTGGPTISEIMVLTPPMG